MGNKLENASTSLGKKKKNIPQTTGKITKNQVFQRNDKHNKVLEVD